MLLIRWLRGCRNHVFKLPWPKKNVFLRKLPAESVWVSITTTLHSLFQAWIFQHLYFVSQDQDTSDEDIKLKVAWLKLWQKWGKIVCFDWCWCRCLHNWQSLRIEKYLENKVGEDWKCFFAGTCLDTTHFVEPHAK